MPAKKRAEKAARSFERVQIRKNRVPLQVPGAPQGKHITGFKGMKTDQHCECGGCHPNAQANHGKSKVINIH